MELKMFAVFLLIVVLFAGCGKKNNEIQGDNRKAEAGMEFGTEQKAETELDIGTDETEGEKGTGKEGTEPKPDEEPESPANYQRESESGKVKFDCKVETPDSFRKDNICRFRVSGICNGDTQSILLKYVEGKEITEKIEEKAQNGVQDMAYCIMADGTVINIDESGYYFSSKNGTYYHNARAMDADYQEEYRKGHVSFASGEDAIRAVRQELDEIGFSEFEFQLVAYPASHEVMQKVEAEVYADEAGPSQKKGTWTQKDDVYVVYGFQTQDTIPIFHRWMTVFRSMAYDNVDNASVQAVYSSRGIEFLMAQPIYYLEDTGETLTLKEFEEIAGIVEAKFENILNESTYVVNRAKLFQMVRLNENQEYAAEPIWYFEVTEDGISKSVTLVDAVTGKEIFLK
ncbi:hypothetical protein V1226_10905 [Lachnospiraceae bacterium JLR.KK009]|nr:hypothetical protein C810_01988 [Lachnospiraceae bacterium A2]MCI8883385.1 hypothetical protein [Lachnospiraceae bacterium]